MGPGTAPTGLPSVIARLAVARAPDLDDASMTMVASPQAASILFRPRKRHFAGLKVGGTSETMAPDDSTIVSKSRV